MVPKTFGQEYVIENNYSRIASTLQRVLLYLNVFCQQEVGSILLSWGYIYLNNRNADLNYIIVFCFKPVIIIRIVYTVSDRYQPCTVLLKKVMHMIILVHAGLLYANRYFFLIRQHDVVRFTSETVNFSLSLSLRSNAFVYNMYLPAISKYVFSTYSRLVFSY